MSDFAAEGHDNAGQVRVDGAIWRALATTPLKKGARVVVQNVDGITLTVRGESDA